MSNTAQQCDDLMHCGYIKAKFPLTCGVRLSDHEAYGWCCDRAHPRVTENFVYVAFGHKVLTENEIARDYIKSIHNLGGKITRIDFHIDYQGKLAFRAFYRLHDNDCKPTPSIVESPVGTTVYVGKRSSARMLRVYDKRGEIRAKNNIDIGFDITRIELEVKRNMISRYVALFMTGKTDIILSDIQRLYGLHGFCASHKPSKPTHNRERKDSHWSFVTRYKRIILCAYSEDKEQFLDVIGAKNDD